MVHGAGCRVQGAGCRVQGTGCMTMRFISHAPSLSFRTSYWSTHTKRFRGRLVFKAHRKVYHSTLRLRAIKEKKGRGVQGAGCRVQGTGCRVQGA